MIRRSPLTDLAPDYLLLGFFCVTLYYQERLIFFDLLIKRGMFFCVFVLLRSSHFSFCGALPTG